MSLTRAQKLEQLRGGTAEFEIVVIGGGITGAGVAREAAGSGLRTLLIEQNDFSWGTSSRSSKMVHGGLRYLGSGQFNLTKDAVRERERLMAEAPGLIEPLRFIMPHYRKQFPGPRLFQILLRVYDRIARNPSRQHLSAAETLQWVPGLATDNLVAASGFTDAVTDDSRLVQRVIEEAEADGALCLNYLKAEAILRDGDSSRVTGIELRDTSTSAAGQTFTISTALAINATGAWAKALQQTGDDTFRIRPLRGSHLVLPFSRLPVSCSVSLFHPRDRRPVFAFPWQGTTVLGTTDLDHEENLSREPAITREELDYLLEISGTLFPASGITENDIIATWAGVRPVVSEQGKNAKPLKPSQENREHVIWSDNGLISIAGGKLTTFRLIAREVLEKAQNLMPGFSLRNNDARVFSPPAKLVRPQTISHRNWERLQGFYGPALGEILNAGCHDTISGSDILWSELAWAAANTGVVHLDDLLLRRTRLGLILPSGGKALLPEIRMACQPVLGWDDDTWELEQSRYLGIWQAGYSLPADSGESA
ncbi:glycerol-3-phosphate dehydrogenase/oxidase [Marinobacter orientalis]|uniref:Glycerol-3-phosphate dehydrogenase/oxidase n=1 Tax=Marinobacter orientalis TaxID=1928859 RepID=A0A7Y0RES7_9GAMM|nr:glycerol-3-phosphate dehydrogenase/oxidase [Marinobacter orientalis]NMT64927.1 glycerol-3-phosphate dehydrogenase/oxidase [Marinobacter orientalis]TGX48176.1 glycerol-3-phosphate dehydrogenase/oxidase [Marinobacter orientalis]